MKSIKMLVKMMVLVLSVVFCSASVQADALNLTVRHFDTEGVVFTGDLPIFYTQRTPAPQVNFKEVGSNTILTSSGLEHDTAYVYLPFYQYSTSILNLYSSMYFPLLTPVPATVMVNESKCYFKYYGDSYVYDLSYREVRELVVTLTFPGGYSNAQSAPGNLPIRSLAFQLVEKNLGTIQFPLDIQNGTTRIKYRVVVRTTGYFTSEYSISVLSVE
jgi:hypothetical protein